MFNRGFKLILMAAAYVSTTLAGETKNDTVEFTKHKILIAGSLEPSEHDYFMQVARALAENPETRNEVYILNFETKKKVVKTITKIQDRLFTIQAPEVYLEQNTEHGRAMKLVTFQYNPYLTEEENYVNLDQEHYQSYFRMIGPKLDFFDFLNEQNFTVGIGGLYFTDTLLFRMLGINFLKLTPEDVEGYTMQFKLGMPVLLSSYPNSKSFSAFEFNDLPSLYSHTYRWKAIKDYVRMKYARYNHIRWFRSKMQHHLLKFIDDYDQDHAMIIAEGTNAGLFQSIMMKPPNVKPVYPIRKQKAQKEQIYITSYKKNNLYSGKKGPVVIWNLESLNPRSPMYAFSESQDMDYFLRSFRELDYMWKKDYDLYILAHPSQAKMVQKVVDSYDFGPVQEVSVHAIEDPFNTNFTDFSADMISQWNRPVFWMGMCTQQNFIAAIENFKAVFIGYANPKVQTQVFNCHKVEQFGVGVTVDLEDVHDDEVPRDRLFSALYRGVFDLTSSNYPNIKFFSHLLHDDQRISKMDLEYWIDYVYLFGVKELIPLYDKMDIITYHNWDVYILNWSLFFAVLFIVRKCLSCCCGGRKADEQAKVKTE